MRIKDNKVFRENIYENRELKRQIKDNKVCIKREYI